MANEPEPSDAAPAAMKSDAVEQSPEIRHALREIGIGDAQAAGGTIPVRSRMVLFALAGCGLAAIVLYIALRTGLLTVPLSRTGVIERLLLGGAIACGVILLVKLAEGFLVVRLGDDASRFNMLRIIRLVAEAVEKLV